MATYARLETTIILALGAVLTFALAWQGGLWFLLPLLLTLALLSFYRDPRRRIDARPDALRAPADGRIMLIERGHAGADGRPELRICIFLSVLNVHVNRSPCAARVAGVRYEPGRFLNALSGRATDENENNLVELDPIDPLPGPVLVRQIAGALARRIVCGVGPGDTLRAGARFGMIKLGSQTELRVPEDPRWRVRVAVGDRVRGGLTVLAELAAEQT